MSLRDLLHSLSFVSLDSKESVGDKYTKRVKKPALEPHVDLTKYSDQVSPEVLSQALEAIVNAETTVPVILAIKNISSSGIRNPYLELIIQSESGVIEVSESIQTEGSAWESFFFRMTRETYGSPLMQKANSVLAELQNRGLVRQGDAWKLSSEWGALQPQRVLFLKPFYVGAKSSSEVKMSARIFSDSFPQPLRWVGTLEIIVEESALDLRPLVREIVASKRKGNKPGQV